MQSKQCVTSQEKHYKFIIEDFYGHDDTHTDVA